MGRHDRPFFTMITFYSQHFQKEYTPETVKDLSPDDAWIVHSEVVRTITELDEALENAIGPTYTEQWKHKVKTKRRICIVFREKLGLCLSPGRVQVEGWRQERRFRRAFDEKMRAILEKEFEDDEVKQIFKDCHEAAKEDYRFWLESNKYEPVFIP
jgi:hypothetical protein